MHHTVEMVLPAAATDETLAALEKIEGVLALSVERDAGVKPPGDVVTVHALNRSIDDVLAAASHAQDHGRVAVATGGVSSIVATGAQSAIDDDADETPWEEFERSLRHHGRLSVNYLVLMVLGGAIGVAGLLSPPVPQALALAACAVLAPAFEPVAMLGVALVRRSGYAIRRAVVSIVVGYLLMAAGGGLAFVVLRALGLASPKTLASSEGMHLILDPTAADWLVAAAGALAGLVIVTSFREAVLAGALIALALVPAAGVLGMGVVSLDAGLVLEGLQRLGGDMALVVVLGGLVVLAKDQLVHRGRRPLA
ncbi:DUF389 domain-containing protein [Actinomycetospora sp. TBRC 11914]|uniref:DUF389 domain-containing protein n=1 Tax=Actinomycetospora sp. TBRC 11914 TaxID=2729387 RepID=UPI00145E2856|nr:DUF389 domain-containing protein [Actinomycetospora sp. TBRC 11914]NMO91087.1 DUF389 domain-containing protein [Actinomycetospora sp. TBRC 11914]